MSETRPEGGSEYSSIPRPPGNSNRDREAKKEAPEKKEIRQVTTGRIRKKGLGAKFKETFGGEDARTVGANLLFEVAIPALQNLIVDMVQQGVERKIFGDSSPNRTRRASESRPRVNYGASYRSSRDYRTRGEPRERSYGARERETHDFDQVIIDGRGEAEDILDQMGNLLEQYDAVTVSDMYRMVGIRGSFVDDSWGWTSLRGASVRHVREGYILDLPTPIHLDRRV